METISTCLKALGDETRLRILHLLFDDKEYCVCDLMAALEMPQSTVSRHLAYLKNSGWISGRRQNKWMYYRLDQNGGAVSGAILPVLKNVLSGTEQASLDRKKLEIFIKEKDTKTCE
jgi:ArsR family transcriptional regulator